MLCSGSEAVLSCADLAISGTHNEFNALAAIAVTDTLGASRQVQGAVLRRFRGLAHRCALVAEHAGVAWINDSKGTNVGASAAAIIGIFAARGGVLIAGGQGKGADFHELRGAVAGRVHTVVVLGEDGPRIAATLGDLVRVETVGNMREAVEVAAARAVAGDAVLLSPACASFDMFRNYEARGQAFEAAVREQVRT
jgi:UDP-N-acetylmuramoylalanine--D-glutamate ligase